MAIRKSAKKSSLLAKYSLQYQKKPKSRVFAPLAETYRKLGMRDESLKVLREGIKYHPAYTLGYIVLSHVYFDQQNFELAYSTLRPFVTDNLENITLQKLFAKICINLGYLEEALQTFKYLLLINPRDHYTAEQVKLLEDDLLVNEDNEFESSYVEKRMTSFDDESDENNWVQVDFNQDRRKQDEEQVKDDEYWEMDVVNPLDKFKKDLNKEDLVVEEQDLDDSYFLEEYDNDAEEPIIEENTSEQEIQSDPIITHTLVNLYCKQGHLDKALEILESIISLHPEDTATAKKILEIKESMSGDIPESIKSIQAPKLVELDQIPNEDSEMVESGHNELLNLIESKRQNDKELLLAVKIKLQQFSDAIRIESTRKQLSL